MYDIFPFFPLPDGCVRKGCDTLAKRIAGCKRVFLDGYQGVYFAEIKEKLEQELHASGIRSSWHNATSALKPEKEIAELIAPFLGGDDPLFGTRCTLQLEDFFDMDRMSVLGKGEDNALQIIYGPGASLAGGDGCIVYIDLPKDEMQYRARAGRITNLGAEVPFRAKAMYKRFYFVDWVVLNRHKEMLSSKVDVFADGKGDSIAWLEGRELRNALHEMSSNVFRVRPWFEPGAWGGTWIKDHIAGLRKDVPNYAWSFEMIVPENGLVFGSSTERMEVSFDWLMFLEAKAVLGDCHERFGSEFPIRFDFLDTFDGGNLSIQCHPQEEYIQKKFGEKFTQQEAYYILDTKENAHVNLGFQENINPDLFRKNLEKSAVKKSTVDIPFFVQQHPASRHDFFLIPEGTIHGSGTNNLVLEISTTPYIFTFKMYDWLRLDLDGNPRDLNIGRAFENLDFSRKGEIIGKDFISKPELIEEGEGWKKFRLPTHPLHYYDVWRYHISTSAVIHTLNKCQVLSLVEGERIILETENGMRREFHYAETFCIPAACGSYTVTNPGKTGIMLIIAFIR